MLRKNVKRVPSRLCDISSGTDLWAVALDDDNKWLYYVTARGRLGRIDVDNPTNNEILFEHNILVAVLSFYIAL